MKAKFFALPLLTLSLVSFADESAPVPNTGSSSMICNNLDPKGVPANVLLISSPQGLEGVFGAANVQGPREIFDAPVKSQDKTSTVYGPIRWTGSNDGLALLSASVKFDSSGQITAATFNGANGKVILFGSCTPDSDE